tara:strand:+ start:2327 stop:2707 length:381 start_codon:yes stop_codon:yes gene_type:complete
MMRTPLTLVLLLTLAINALADTPRISARLDSKPDATLTSEEQRAVSIAGRLLRHAYDAMLALDADDADDAEGANEAIALSEQLVQVIENAVPSVTIQAKIIEEIGSFTDALGEATSPDDVAESIDG